MTGIVADFLSELVEINPTLVTQLAPEASRLEEEILHGQIVLAGEPSPEIFYRTAGRDYPINRTSSMVSELAPVVLYLRHVLGPGDLLIIEEPEAHLHPAAQVTLARGLVRLVNLGLRVSVTTHSEYFLQQINSTIMAGALPKEAVTDLNVAGEQLNTDKVAAYYFDPKESGTRVTRLKINPREGIPNLGFDAVTELQYNELATLDRRIGDQEDG
jgi:predicted ATPase